MSLPTVSEILMDEKQPVPRISKAAALFEDISITPAFNITLVDLAKEGK